MPPEMLGTRSMGTHAAGAPFSTADIAMNSRKRYRHFTRDNQLVKTGAANTMHLNVLVFQLLYESLAFRFDHAADKPSGNIVVADRHFSS